MPRINTKGDAVPGAGVPIPIRFILMSRRIMFLQTILQEDESSLLHRFFQAQLNHLTGGNWCQSVDKAFLFPYIKSSLSALEYLNAIKAKHSKVLNIPHTTLEMQSYLKPSQITIIEAKFIFLVRTRMLDVKTNFTNKYNDVKYPNCMEEDT